MSEVASAALALLDAAQERMIASDERGLMFDWPGAEAILAVAQGLGVADEEGDEGAALKILALALHVLAATPAGAPRHAFQRSLGLALRQAGVHSPGLLGG